MFHFFKILYENLQYCSVVDRISEWVSLYTLQRVYISLCFIMCTHLFNPLSTYFIFDDSPSNMYKSRHLLLNIVTPCLFWTFRYSLLWQLELLWLLHCIQMQGKALCSRTYFSYTLQGWILVRIQFSCLGNLTMKKKYGPENSLRITL
jgi:hypothetical protein